MVNPKIAKSIGLVKDVGYGTAGVSANTPPKASSIMSNKNTASTRCGYGVGGVNVSGGGSKGRSHRRSAGSSPPTGQGVN